MMCRWRLPGGACSKNAHEIQLLRRLLASQPGRMCAPCAPASPGRMEYEIEADTPAPLSATARAMPAMKASSPVGPTPAALCQQPRCAARWRLAVDPDAGCEWTRATLATSPAFPVNGRFSGEQRAVYDIGAGRAVGGIDAIGLRGLECAQRRRLKPCWCRADRPGACSAAAWTGNIESNPPAVYMHRIGHWLGLDVHDVILYKAGRPMARCKPAHGHHRRTLACTYRPAANVAGTFAGIGIRIEDDVLVSDTGPELLTADAPNGDAIEALMAAARPP